MQSSGESPEGDDKDDSDDKDAKILSLTQQLKDANKNIEMLQGELYREKCINNRLLGIPPPFEASPQQCSQTPFSPTITPAQRRPSEHASFVTVDSLYESPKSPIKLDLSMPNNNDSLDEQSARSPENSEDDDHSSKSLAPIHPRDAGPADKMLYILKSLKNLPRHKSTLLVGDSNLHSINGELDPERKSVAIRSVSGLCVVSAAHALKQYQYKYGQVHKVVWSLGVNDHLHRREHRPHEWLEYLDMLINETKRIFCNASIHFLLPYKGLPGVPLEHCKEISDLLAKYFPSVKRHYAPSMEGKVKPDGIHLNKDGVDVLREFLVNRFTKFRPNPPATVCPPRETNMDQRCTDRPPSTHPVITNETMLDRPQTPFNVNYGGFQQPAQMNMRYPPIHYGAPHFAPPPPAHANNRIREMSEALVNVLYMHMNRSLN